MRSNMVRSRGGLGRHLRVGFCECQPGSGDAVKEVLTLRLQKTDSGRSNTTAAKEIVAEVLAARFSQGRNRNLSRVKITEENLKVFHRNLRVTSITSGPAPRRPCVYCSKVFFGLQPPVVNIF